MHKTVAECMLEISQRDAQQLQDIHATIMEFFNGKVNYRTVWQWIHGVRLPSGVNLIKLITILESMGYSLSEYIVSSQTMRAARECLAFGLIDEEEIKAHIFTEYESREHIYALMFGKSKPMPGSEAIVATNIEFMLSDLQVLKERWRTAFSVFKLTAIREQPVTAKQNALTKQNAIDFLVGVIAAGIPIAKWILSDDFTADDRKQLRKKAGDGGVFEFKNALARLCGERAREELNGLKSTTQEPKETANV